jgi:hypothetical protein
MTTATDGQSHKCLTQLSEWLQHGFIYNHLLFACSFTPNGDLLSQWRAYCPPGKGVSLGFNPDHLVDAADSQAFYLARCIYRREEQMEMVDEILNLMVNTADDQGEAPPNKRHPTQSYYDAFERHEDRLLNVAAVIKHPAFAEEDEWRAISRVSRNLRDSSLRFRESTARLIPYVEFSLPKSHDGAVSFEHVYVGSAPEASLAFGATDIFLTNSRATPTRGLSASCVPWRPW